jgi:hypothetical protein
VDVADIHRRNRRRLSSTHGAILHAITAQNIDAKNPRLIGAMHIPLSSRRSPRHAGAEERTIPRGEFLTGHFSLTGTQAGPCGSGSVSIARIADRRRSLPSRI